MLRHLTFALVALLCSVGHARDHVALIGTYTDTSSRGIYAVKLDAETGALSSAELVAELPNPEFLALHPNGRFVYALTDVRGEDGQSHGAVVAFSVDASTGHLRRLNVESTQRPTLCHIAVDATGRMLVVAAYGGGYVASYPIFEDGRVGPVASVIEHRGPLGPNTGRQEAPHPHSVTISPDNRFAFVADLGLDRIFAYRLSPENGTISAHEPAFVQVAPGAGPRHTVFSRDGKSFYAVDELQNQVTAFRYDAERGALQIAERTPTLPDDFTGSSTTSEIRVHPHGRFLYAGNRGHNSIAVFARDDATGALTRVQIEPSGGNNPRNFALTPDGKWLVSAQQIDGNLTVFSVDAEKGVLTRTPHGTPAIRPVCVLFLR
ncbi:MAG: lactonase family protein [Opitutus sp.]|nr:lactonase family protein [Opitutus sp.]